MPTNGTPERWTQPDGWKHGARSPIAGDMAQIPETAGESNPPSSRRHVSLITDIAFLLSATAVLAALYLLADWMVKR